MGPKQDHTADQITGLEKFIDEVHELAKANDLKLVDL